MPSHEASLGRPPLAWHHHRMQTKLEAEISLLGQRRSGCQPHGHRRQYSVQAAETRVWDPQAEHVTWLVHRDDMKADGDLRQMATGKQYNFGVLAVLRSESTDVNPQLEINH